MMWRHLVTASTLLLLVLITENHSVEGQEPTVELQDTSNTLDATPANEEALVRRRDRGRRNDAARLANERHKKAREERRQQRRRKQAAKNAPSPLARYPEGEDMQWLLANISALWAVVHDLQLQHPTTMQSALLKHKGENGFGSTSSFACITPPHLTERECNERSVATCQNSANSSVCSGHGECCCGSCICNALNYGRYCECSNNSTCERSGGLECSGHGICRCGTCTCDGGWTGSVCQCLGNEAKCLNEVTGSVCSDNGVCNCGSCRCNAGFFGSVCNETLYSAGVCEQLKPCVLCGALGKTFPQCRSCGHVFMEMVPALKSSLQLCRMVHFGCLLQYSYETVGSTYHVRVPQDLTC